MSSDNTSSHSALKLALKFVLNVVVVGMMDMYLSQYFGLGGGFPAYVIVGALLTLLNLFFRPVLAILLAPLKFIAGIIALILMHGLFVQLVVLIIERMDPNFVVLEIFGGLWGWVVVASCFGIANAILNKMFK